MTPDASVELGAIALSDGVVAAPSELEDGDSVGSAEAGAVVGTSDGASVGATVGGALGAIDGGWLGDPPPGLGTTVVV
jgi:hypothetical protein